MMGKKYEKLPNTYGDPCTGDIAQHNLPVGRCGRGKIKVKINLSLPPHEIGGLVRQRFPNCRQSSIDKVCLLIGEAYTISLRQRKNGKGCFEVSNAWAETIISRIKGKRPLKLLCEIGLIEPDVPYRATIRPKAITYRFKIQSFKAYQIVVSGKAAEKCLNKGKQGLNRRTTDPVQSWVDESMKRAGLFQDDLNDYQRRPNHKDDSAKFAKGERIQSWKGAYR